MKKFKFRFDADTVEITQEVVILDEEWSESAIIEGLNNKTLLTTTWHNQEEKSFIEKPSGAVIALIVSQEVDGYYDNFELIS